MSQANKTQYPRFLLNPRPYKPLPVMPGPTLLTGEPSSKAIAQYKKDLFDYAHEESTEQEEVLHILMDVYRIDRNQEDRWKTLSKALAKDHVRAMDRHSAPQGYPKKWTGTKGLILLTEVYNLYIDALVNENFSSRHSQIDERLFLKQVKKAYPEKYRAVSPDTLKRAFRTAKKAFPEMVETWDRVMDHLSNRG